MLIMLSPHVSEWLDLSEYMKDRNIHRIVGHEHNFTSSSIMSMMVIESPPPVIYSPQAVRALSLAIAASGGA